MSRKQKMVIEAETIWQAQKPRYNAWQNGHGPHGDTKYSRKVKHKNREEW